MPDRSEHSANRDLHTRAAMPRPGRSRPASAPRERRPLPWYWQAGFAALLGLLGAWLLICGLSDTPVWLPLLH